jgi:hypothetical protein
MDSLHHPEFYITRRHSIVFSSYVEIRTMVRVHEPSISEFYTLSSDPFRFYSKGMFIT